jgi:hypothetical protein
MATTDILAEFAPEAALAEEFGVSERTIARYRAEPDGLPYVLIGNRVHIHLPGAREWLARRTRRPNPRRS